MGESSFLFDQPAITAIAPYAGGKRTLAPTIVAELGPHVKYDDPFCGSLAVPFAKERCSFETVNDLYGDLVNLARVLKSASAAKELHERLSRTLMHEQLFHDAATQWHARGYQPAPEAGDVDRAEEFMICSWFGRNGVCGTSSYNQGFCVRYTKNGGHAGKRWCSAVDSIPAWHERLRMMTILNRDGFELLERLEDADKCAIYCDPPYVKKGFKYVKDFGDGDHERLARCLNRFKKTRVVVSYYEHPLLDDLYRGWTKREVYTTKALVSQGQRGEKGKATVAPEILLINGPSLSPQGELR